MNINYDAIPQEMKECKNWVCWRYINTKVPFYRDDDGIEHSAAVNAPETWKGIDDTVATKTKYDYDGIGYVFSKDTHFAGVDIDHCVIDGQANAEAQFIIDSLDSYTELSPSGSGIHIIVRKHEGQAFQHGVNQRGITINFKGRILNFEGIEAYTHDRFFTVTGNVYQGRGKIDDRGDEIQELWDSLDEASNRKRKGYATVAVNKKKDVPSRPLSDLELVDIIARIRKSKQAPMFEKFWSGKWDSLPGYEGKSQSEADQGFMNMLCFWVKGNREAMRQLFSMSALGQREKWINRPDYQKRTIKTALASWNGKSYDPDAYKREHGAVIDSPDKYPDIRIMKNGDKRPVVETLENTAYCLNALGITIRLNLLTKAVEINGYGLEKLSFDSALTKIRGMCCRNYLPIKKADLFDNVSTIAEQHKYSPVCEYLRQCMTKWDGKDHIEVLFSRLTLSDYQTDVAFCKKLFHKWLLSCVVLAFNEGTKSADGILVLVGAQGIGKTRFLHTLVPSDEWCLDGMTLDPASKDDKMTVNRYWIVELGEVDDTIQREKVAKLKSYITASKDSYREPYKRASQTFPRTTVFMATTNDDQFLKDATGDRRYWTLEVISIDNDSPLDIEQVWGQAMYLVFEKHESHHLDEKDIKELYKHNLRFTSIPPTMRLLLDGFDWTKDVKEWKKYTASEVCKHFRLPATHNRRIAKAIRQLAKSDKRIKIPTSNHSKLYLLPPCDFVHGYY